ncbi:MAG TPA: galactokinase family protein, partial [Bryobacteraceae bacterium]|nr:galactokinase family protein [Bryobacteraceae bacterium]
MNPQDAIDRFNALYPSSQPARVFRAPGRVNLIGEHTDYNQGLALPMAIDLSCAVVAAKSRDSCLRAFSNQFQELAKWTPEELERFALRGGWSDRVLGVVWALRQRKIAVEAQNLYIDSEIPLGGGLSSSAALGVALTLALGGPRDPLELTRIAHSAEAGFLGIPCGVLDQFASAHGIAGTALLLDCKILAWEPAPLPPDAVIVAVNSMVKRDL